MKLNRKLLALIALFSVVQLKATVGRAEDMVIALESAGLRAQPHFFDAVQASVPYGAKVEVVATEGAWMQVKYKTHTGWIHKSAFGKADAILHDIGKGEAATKDTYKDEVVTAGKGFNDSRKAASKDEPFTKETDANLKYEAVDQIENRKVPAPKMKEFMEKGGLESKVIGK